MKKSINYFLILTVLMLISSCSYDSENDLIETINQQGAITYDKNIQSVINNNCLACHSDPTKNGAPFSLNNYETVLTRAQNGQLLRAISRQTGESRAMPPSGRLPLATIDLVEQWIQEGAQE